MAAIRSWACEPVKLLVVGLVRAILEFAPARPVSHGNLAGCLRGEIGSRTPVVAYDILPTICDLAGITNWPKAVAGGSLKPG